MDFKISDMTDKSLIEKQTEVAQKIAEIDEKVKKEQRKVTAEERDKVLEYRDLSKKITEELKNRKYEEGNDSAAEPQTHSRSLFQQNSEYQEIVSEAKEDLEKVRQPKLCAALERGSTIIHSRSIGQDVYNNADGIVAASLFGKFLDYASRRERGTQTFFNEYMHQESDRLKLHSRANTGLTSAENQDVIAHLLDDHILAKAFTLSPLFQNSKKIYDPQVTELPVYKDEDPKMKFKNVNEFEQITGGTGAYETIKLSSTTSALAVPIPRRLLGRTSIPIVQDQIEQISKKYASFMDAVGFLGDDADRHGLNELTTVLTTKSDFMTADEIRYLMHAVHREYRNNAAFYMHDQTLCKLSTLKNAVGDYYFVAGDITQGIPDKIFGYPIYVSDNMPEPKAGAPLVYFGDMSETLCYNIPRPVSIKYNSILGDLNDTDYLISLVESGTALMRQEAAAVLKRKA